MENEKFADGEVPLVHFEEMHETVRYSATLGELCKALATAQLEFETIKKDMDNPYYHSKYADLSGIIAATQKPLARNSIVIIQSPVVKVTEQLAGVVSRMVHGSGEWVENECLLPAVMIGKDGRARFDAQSCGSAQTYSRRYAYQSLVGVAAEPDDDGNKAAGIGSKGEAQNVAKAQLEEKSKSPDPKVAAIAKEGLAKINAADTSKDLEGQLKRSLEVQKDDGLFDEVSGVIQGVRQMSTSAAKGNRPYRKIAMVVFENGSPIDIEISAFDNFKMSDTSCFAALDAAQTDDTAAFIVERSGKYLNLKDIKQLGSKHWDARLAITQR